MADGEKRRQVVSVRVVPSVCTALRAEAERHELSLSEYLRLVLIEKVKAVGK